MSDKIGFVFHFLLITAVLRTPYRGIAESAKFSCDSPILTFLVYRPSSFVNRVSSAFRFKLSAARCTLHATTIIRLYRHFAGEISGFSGIFKKYLSADTRKKRRFLTCHSELVEESNKKMSLREAQRRGNPMNRSL